MTRIERASAGAHVTQPNNAVGAGFLPANAQRMLLCEPSLPARISNSVGVPIEPSVTGAIRILSSSMSPANQHRAVDFAATFKQQRLYFEFAGEFVEQNSKINLVAAGK